MAFSKRITTRYPDWAFWSCYLLLNFLLFAPIYLFFREDASFWPLEQIGELELPALVQTLLIERANPDMFRFNFEFTLLVFLWIFVKPGRQRLFLGITFLFYLLQIAYATYEGFVRSYYLLDPIFYNDYFLFIDGVRYVLQSLNLAPTFYAGVLLLLLATVGLCFVLYRSLFDGSVSERLSRSTRWGMASITVLMLVFMLNFRGETGLPETAVSSFVAKIAQNIDLSRTAQAEASRFDSQQMAEFYQFTTNSLRHKPDVHLIFIESYGSVLFKRADFRRLYRQTLDGLQQQLDSNGWHAASNRSLAPTWGGGSWIAYTSALSGLPLDSHSQYLALLNQYQSQPLPHLFNYLRTQGYRSYRLSSIADELNDIEWQRYKNFYGVDEWLRFRDMEYEGPLYGWGPAPPDQYAVNYAYEYMNRVAGTPYVFFYISQNSHYPWYPLPTVADDWRHLNTSATVPPAPTQRPPHEELRQRYLQAIQYELAMLVDLIVKQGDDDDVFILMGDHQPARVARYADGWDTPLHVISRDAGLINDLLAFDFIAGLDTLTVAPTIQHADFYPLFMRILLQNYGADQNNLPAYPPSGVVLDRQKEEVIP